MKAFVTGSTGLLGSNLVRALVAQEYEVTALARSAEQAQKLLGDLDIDLVEGDMREVARFAHRLAECDVLFHVAAYFREYYQPGEHDNLLHEINVKGTINLLEAAVNHQVRNVIYVSTGGVLDTSATDGPVDESAPYNYDTTNLYFESKLQAEEAINKFMETNDVRVILIMPGVMIGPGDSGPSNVGQFVIDFLKNRVRAILPGGFSFVDARDVAQAMIQAVNSGQRGERFLVGGRYYDVDSVLKTLEKVSGVAAPRLHIAYPVAFAFAWMSELISRFTGNPPQLTRRGLRVLQETDTVSSEKAIRELQVEFRPLGDSLRDQVNWYRANGYLA